MSTPTRPILMRKTASDVASMCSCAAALTFTQTGEAGFAFQRKAAFGVAEFRSLTRHMKTDAT